MTRRTALLLGLGASVSAACQRSWAFARGEFWNDKEPSEWSKKEIHRLLSQSPWAVQTTLSTLGEPAGALGDISGGGMGTPGAGRGTAPGTAPATGRGETGGTPQIRVLVRWESAAPVREAAHQPVPAEASEYYIISVSGLPAVGHGLERGTGGPEAAEPRQRMEEQFRETAGLLRKGKDPLRPARVHTVEQAGRRAELLFFPRTPLPITLEDKAVTLASSIGPAQLRVNFSLKDMLYRGKLEL